MLVGNKLDMGEGARKTSREMGEQFAQEEGLLFTEASAKSGDGVEELFLEIGMLLIPAPHIEFEPAHFSIVWSVKQGIGLLDRPPPRAVVRGG